MTPPDYVTAEQCSTTHQGTRWALGLFGCAILGLWATIAATLVQASGLTVAIEHLRHTVQEIREDLRQLRNQQLQQEEP